MDAVAGDGSALWKNPKAAPILAGSYNTLGYAFDVAVAGNFAYVTGQFSGLQIIDITDPAAPSLAGSPPLSISGGLRYRSGEQRFPCDQSNGRSKRSLERTSAACEAKRLNSEPEAEIVGADPRDELKRELSLFDAIFLVVSCVIGAGIFFTPGRVAELVPHPGWILAAWLIGGVLSLAGALANAELGAMYPNAGGNYVYLREGVHPIAGFLVGWLSFFAIFAGTIAALSAVAANVICAALGISNDWLIPIAIGICLTSSALNFQVLDSFDFPFSDLRASSSETITTTLSVDSWAF